MTMRKRKNIGDDGQLEIDFTERLMNSSFPDQICISRKEFPPSVWPLFCILVFVLKLLLKAFCKSCRIIMKKAHTFDELIADKRKEAQVLGSLHRLIDGASPKVKGLVIAKAVRDRIITGCPTKEQFLSEFSLDEHSWQGVHKYFYPDKDTDAINYSAMMNIEIPM